MYWRGFALVAVRTKEQLIFWSFYSTSGHFFGGYATRNVLMFHSIQEHFPDSGIIKRLDILSQPDAELFLKQWPTLRG
jgi:hypothetical protein